MLTGFEMLEHGRRQAEKFGARFMEEDVLDVDREDEKRFSVSLESGKVFKGTSLVLAMGISRNRLNVPGEKELLGRGVSYCIDCDGHFFKDQIVAVIGNESAAASGALALLMIAEEVHLIYKELLVSETLKYPVERSDIVKHPGRWIKAILGENDMEGLVLDNEERIDAAGVFIELGAKGAIELATKLGVSLDPESFRYVVTNKKHETNIGGVYAAGDICGPPWQVAKAVGEGCVAGLEAAGHAKKQK
jgi:thioredoxin reductase (NADPH)